MRIHSIVLPATVVLCALIAQSSRAAFVQFDTSIEFSSGTPPQGTPPWVRLRFDDAGPNTVTMKMTALNLVGQEFVTEWDFNLDPALNPNSLVFSAPTKTGTFADPTISKGVDAFKADGDGDYDVSFNFDNSPPANRFDAGDAVSYTITAPGLTANSFKFLSKPDGGAGPYYTAAHVQGVGQNGGFSGWVAPGPNDVQTPEPASAVVIGLGLVPLLARARRSR
ncbi:MAG TPA: hypothetical protein VH518_03930 [Tepidisphaeraceae bacterium]|jgi:hypothetical protein